MRDFKGYFSEVSPSYRDFCPHYSERLFEHLADMAPTCSTGAAAIPPSPLPMRIACRCQALRAIPNRLLLFRLIGTKLGQNLVLSSG